MVTGGQLSGETTHGEQCLWFWETGRHLAERREDRHDLLLTSFNSFDDFRVLVQERVQEHVQSWFRNSTLIFETSTFQTQQHIRLPGWFLKDSRNRQKHKHRLVSIRSRCFDVSRKLEKERRTMGWIFVSFVEVYHIWRPPQSLEEATTHMAGEEAIRRHFGTLVHRHNQGHQSSVSRFWSLDFM